VFRLIPTLTSELRCDPVFRWLVRRQTQGHGFILVPTAGSYVQQSVRVHYIILHRGACRGGLQARRERGQILQVPARVIGASTNIVRWKCGCESGVGWIQRDCVNMSAARCLPPPSIGQGEVVTRVSHNEMYSGCVLANNTSAVTVVLANPCAWHGLMASFAFRGHHGGSCACWGIALRGSFDWGSRL
jgi:hypothetical protein